MPEEPPIRHFSSSSINICASSSSTYLSCIVQSNKSIIWERSAPIGSPQPCSSHSNLALSGSFQIPTLSSRDPTCKTTGGIARAPLATPACQQTCPHKYSALDQPNQTLGIKMILSPITWPDQQGLLPTIITSSSSSSSSLW